MENTYYSHGKLLLSGEYAVLDGSLALAIPTKKGQWLTVKRTTGERINWESVTADGQVWYRQEFTLAHNQVHPSDQNDISLRLTRLLNEALKHNPEFLLENSHYQVRTLLEFDREWGLGSSSTLLANIARWAKVDPYSLLEATFGGSGYDLAAASAKTPFTYQLENKSRSIRSVDLQWPFAEQLYFVHLNRKQNSRSAIAHYRRREVSSSFIEQVSKLTRKMVNCREMNRFEALVAAHEELLAEVLGVPTVKSELFPEYPGLVKSLGGWGGDFVLVGGQETEMKYFREKGYNTIIRFEDMLL